MVVAVKAQLTGSVWRILVQEGATVLEDETLMILESMKMEIPVEANRAGTVRKLHVREGQAVNEGDVLLEMEAS